MSKNKDNVFSEVIKKPSDFKFGATVASAFDDMVERSVPFYNEIQRMIIEQAAEFAVPGTNVYDLGCSTGTTFLNLDPYVDKDVHFVGIDDSKDMLEKCAAKLQEAKLSRKYELKNVDLHDHFEIENASVVILCLTMQFVRPIYREKLLKKIYDGLVPGGVLIISEKILAEDSLFNRNFIKYYYDYKRRNHYSELEISQKREALENVLIPYKLSENLKLLMEAGFSHTEVFFKWYNFSGFTAIK
ncbi:carboxy-S-adenosyl-L-methionine synthase [Parapedobacter defluvii]|uniref:Carboxy-S-adenosyl-L-methionine synthase n=1 Tax=Parapedobacter defluvii TaxID=2045106 RepID=A0ABQ1MRG7_9SPHI|nr:carboxy-S-adenosyl-L-methionine synthase CmoA [Parapedobacter defluvii]RQP20050.1 MAG: carboxy-S-adenosyl-L-methionine synthase CmoA [Parapedobacter sp.]GGC45504.1 carboxy-S-adenosyl-L-methionine synthase [Parapedobacter defluvii]